MGNYVEIKKIEHLLEEYGIEAKLKDLTKKIEINNTHNIFPDETRQGILDLQRSELNSFDSDKFFDNVSADNLFVLIEMFKVPGIAKTT